MNYFSAGIFFDVLLLCVISVLAFVLSTAIKKIDSNHDRIEELEDRIHEIERRERLVVSIYKRSGLGD